MSLTKEEVCGEQEDLEEERRRRLAMCFLKVSSHINANFFQGGTKRRRGAREEVDDTANAFCIPSGLKSTRAGSR